MPTTPSVRNQPRGFTLIELLVVIGIIVLLISILLPAISKVRQSAYVADTQSEITTISNACHQYFLDSNAFPGPFSNDQIEGYNPVGQMRTLNNPPGAAGGPVTYTGPVSMPQNLVLGLFGGLTIYPIGTTTPTPVYLDTTIIGQGPVGLNPLNAQRKTAYITNSQGLLSNGPFRDGVGNPATDNRYTPGPGSTGEVGIPVFIDRFSGNQMPILYLRARTSGAGIVSNITPNSPLASQKDVAGQTLTQKLQYDLNQINAYTGTQPAVIGSLTYMSKGVTVTKHGLSTVGKFLAAAPPGTPSTVAAEFPDNAGCYFRDLNVVPGAPVTDESIQLTGRPRKVDEFILISAGKDGTYGTPDDLTNFGDVSQ